MANLERVKEFAVERQRRLRHGPAEYTAGGDEVLEEIRALRAEVKALRDSVSAHPAGPVPTGEPAHHDVLDDEQVLGTRIEIAQMVRAIGQAKIEIASIRHPMAEDDRIKSATSELDAIVAATEASTHDVLAAAEAIEGAVRKIAGLHHDDEEVVTLTDQIGNQIITIFESCNFQDITGQRINKVVKTIRFIEARVLSMIDIWGAESFADLPLPAQAGPVGDAGLMNGPALANKGISQEEINALFD